METGTKVPGHCPAEAVAAAMAPASLAGITPGVFACTRRVCYSLCQLTGEANNTLLELRCISNVSLLLGKATGQ